jgi:HAD superfamily hydrolase (TIGR01459 family)
MPDLPRLLPGLAALADQHDGFILDLWGCVHDGIAPYPGVIDCLLRLRARGKAVCLLSNAPRRVPVLAARLERMGIDTRHYDHLMSSGEATHAALASRSDAAHAALGRRFLHLGPPRDDSVHEGLGLERVRRPEEADFILNTGIDRAEETVADHAPLLAAAAARDLPMVCANPDMVVVVGGRRQICAGALAAAYEEMGGRVIRHGKPLPGVYRSCLALMGAPDPRRVLAVGDGLETDIAGARTAGLPSVLVAGGIHAEALALAADGRIDPAGLACLLDDAPARPDAVIPILRW